MINSWLPGLPLSFSYATMSYSYRVQNLSYVKLQRYTLNFRKRMKMDIGNGTVHFTSM